ncbi:hypothetical protein [Nocardioides panacihumi]|uniref:hypothetical protein n=1 Tax=Nocardioides panacihumi TaxID=400774 RepID=UPI0031D4DFF5
MFRTALLALALPALFACSSHSTKDSSAASTGPSTSRDSAGSEAVVRQPQQLTGTQLEDTLPTSGDMSAIFSRTQESQSGRDYASFLCGADVDHPDRRNAEAKVGYVAQVGFSATRYSFGISQFDSPAVAVEQIQALGDAIDACTTFTANGDTYTVAPLSAPRSDEDTIAVQATTKSAGFAVDVSMLMVRTGSSLVASLSSTVGLAEGSTVDDLVRLSKATVGRYEAAAGIA